LKGHSIREYAPDDRADGKGAVWGGGGAKRFNRRTVGDERQQLFDPEGDMVNSQKNLPLSHFVNDMW
jgi:hypothetical protein